MDPYQQTIALTRYARFLPAENRRETWSESVRRYVFFMHDRYHNLFPADDAFDAIHGLSVMPSMRAIMTAGPALDRTNVPGYNCSALCLDHPYAFDEMLLILMCGTGVGFSVERQFIGKLPEVAAHFRPSGHTIVVQDSKEGWAEAFRELLYMLWGGLVPKWDMSQLRPAGAPLMTFGGRSSGPGPLMELFKFAVSIFRGAAGRRLESLECHDLACKIGEVVVVGGVRRSALISLSNLSDLRMREAKYGQFWQNNAHRTMANNSVAYTERPELLQFMDEWRALITSQSGERGIFNRQAAIKKSLTLTDHEGNPRPRTLGNDTVTNPCFSGETLIVTDEGAEPIENMVGRTVRVWTLAGWQTTDTFRVTGTDQHMLTIETQDGSQLNVTPYHTMIMEDGIRKPASEIEPGDRLMLSDVEYSGKTKERGAYLKGFLTADGTYTHDRPILWIYKPKYMCAERLIKSALELVAGKTRTSAVEEVGFRDASSGRSERMQMQGIALRKEELFPWATVHKTSLPDRAFTWDRQSKLDFIAGVMDGDGTVMDTANGWGYQVSSIHYNFLTDLNILLKSIGVRSKISRMHKAQMRDMPGGTYECKEIWRLTISQESAIKLSQQVDFSRLRSLADKKTTYNLKVRAGLVVDVFQSGVEDKVYCCTVPNTHSVATANGIMTGQCAEILLRNMGFCNLSSVVVREQDDFSRLSEKVRLAAILGTFQATLTYFPYLRAEWTRNAEEERLLGVSLSGIMDNPLINRSSADAASMLADLRKIAVQTNIEWAGKLGINPAAAVTCVKPEGTSSQLTDSSSGIHGRYAKHYVRTIRGDVKDPVSTWLQNQGVPCEPDRMSPQNVVFSFPIKAPAHARIASDIGAIEQLDHWLMFARHWSEHNPSITVYVRENEWLDVAAWVFKHFDEVNGLSFLPYSDHVYEQAPYQPVTAEEYEVLAAAFPKLDVSSFQMDEYEDHTKGAQELACVSGVCEMP